MVPYISISTLIVANLLPWGNLLFWWFPTHPSPRSRPLGVHSSPSTMGARRLHLRLAPGSADSVCLRVRRYLHNAPPRPHTRPRTLITPLHATTLHSHLLPTNTSAPHSHLYFGYKLPVRFARFAHLGLSQPSVRTELPSTSTHALAKYTKEPRLYPPPPLTKERSSVRRAQAPHRLVSRWCPVLIHSSNRLHCLDVCLT